MRTKTLPWLFTVLVILVQQTHASDKIEATKALIDRHIDSITRNEEWWVVKLPPGRLSDSDRKELNLSIDELIHVLEPYKNLNDSTVKIFTGTTNSGWGLLRNVTPASKDWEIEMLRKGYYPMIVITPQSLKNSNCLETLFFGDKSARLFFIPGMDIPKQFLAAMFYHEYGHMLQPDGSDKDICEAQMHDLSIQIMTVGKPEYAKKISEIIHRKGIKSYQDAMFSITEKDLKELDGIIIPKKFLRKQIVSYVCTNHFLAVGFAYDDEFTKKGMAEKALMYHFLASQISVVQ